MPKSWRFIDLSGQRFGCWTAVEYLGGSRWRIVCDCGTERVRTCGELRSGRTLSCGCRYRGVPSRRRVDLTGQTFGLLTVLERYEGGKRTSWRCRCACGKEIITTTENLRGPSRGVRSCGCVRGPNHQNPQASNFTVLIARYRRAAKARKLEWDLSREEATALFLAPCHYCGAEPGRVFCEANPGYPILVGGIDRMNPAHSYVADNVVPCCSVCNLAKMDRSYESYVAWVLCSADHLRQKEDWHDT